MGRIAALTCLSVLLILSADRPNWSASSGAPRWVVSAADTEAAAKKLVETRSAAKLGQLSEWKGARVGEPEPYYGLDGDVAAYCLPVAAGDKEVGYVIVAASGLKLPVQEFSTGPPPHKRADLVACRKAANDAVDEGKELGTPRYVCPVPGFHLVEYPVVENGENRGSVFVDVSTSKVVKDFLVPAKLEPNVSRTGKAKSAWLALDEKSERSAAETKPEFRYVVNVPVMRRRTCSESSAGAAILNYWGIRKAREIPELIAKQLAKSISEDLSLAASMQSFAKERGYGLKLAGKSRNAEEPTSRATFTDVRMETDLGRPFLVKLTNRLADGKEVSVTHVGAGHAVDELGQWLILHTGGTTAEGAIAAKESAPWSRPGVVFLNWDCAADSLQLTFVEVKRDHRHEDAEPNAN